MDTAAFRQELERRLAVIDDTGDDDPARTELPRLDWILLLAGCVLLNTLALAWGYPW